jgi:hypothetical protein
MYIGLLEINGTPYIGAAEDQESLQMWLVDAYNAHLHSNEVVFEKDEMQWKVMNIYELLDLENIPDCPYEVAVDIRQTTDAIECTLVNIL